MIEHKIYTKENAESYLQEVFGITLKQLPKSPTILDCIRENAEEGYPLDIILLQLAREVTNTGESQDD